jgi:hypothetical protein
LGASLLAPNAMPAAVGSLPDPFYASILSGHGSLGTLGASGVPPLMAQPLDPVILLENDLPCGIVLSPPFKPPEHSMMELSENSRGRDPPVSTSGALAEAEPRAQGTWLSPVGLASLALCGIGADGGHQLVDDGDGLRAGMASAGFGPSVAVLGGMSKFHDLFNLYLALSMQWAAGEESFPQPASGKTAQ